MRLLRRREILVPTFAGWVLLAALGGAILFGALRGVYPFLATTDPVGGGILVVEGWGGTPVFAEAARRFASGGYDEVLASGGPIERDSPVAFAHTWAEYAVDGLARMGVPSASLHAVPAPASKQDRTFRSAVTVRKWLAARATPVARIEVVTIGPHARRSRRLYELAFGPGVAVGIVSAAPDEYDAAQWWRSSEGAKSVLAEAIGWTWMSCCFAPGPRGSPREEWGE